MYLQGLSCFSFFSIFCLYFFLICSLEKLQTCPSFMVFLLCFLLTSSASLRVCTVIIPSHSPASSLTSLCPLVLNLLQLITCKHFSSTFTVTYSLPAEPQYAFVEFTQPPLMPYIMLSECAHANCVHNTMFLASQAYTFLNPAFALSQIKWKVQENAQCQ